MISECDEETVDDPFKKINITLHIYKIFIHLIKMYTYKHTVEHQIIHYIILFYTYIRVD